MEFHHNLNYIFKNSISKINHTLLPVDFSGDRRNSGNYAAQVAEIIDEMGVASAKAQDLHHPVTSAVKLRSSEHTIYLMTDAGDNNGYGSAVGILKVGMKNLFLNDANGKIHEKKSLSVLDFYVHESKQRMGFGKKLYDYMLNEENIEPCKLSFDKPTVSLLLFLRKHYGLEKIQPQTNNFVLFEGFFKEDSDSIDSSDNPASPKHLPRNGFDNQSVQSDKYLPNLYGRHTAFKLPDTMAEIMWQEPNVADLAPAPIKCEDFSTDVDDTGRHAESKHSYSMHQVSNSSICQMDEEESNDAVLATQYNSVEYSPDMNGTGRHTAFKLPDTMRQIVEQDDLRDFKLSHIQEVEKPHYESP